VLASGSLTELAQAYGISYPTVRLRLDRLIAKVKVLENQKITGVVIGLLARKGRGRGLALLVLKAVTALGAVSLAFGAMAVLRSQP
jgi:hypothetical protein